MRCTQNGAAWCSFVEIPYFGKTSLPTSMECVSSMNSLQLPLPMALIRRPPVLVRRMPPSTCCNSSLVLFATSRCALYLFFLIKKERQSVCFLVEWGTTQDLCYIVLITDGSDLTFCGITTLTAHEEGGGRREEGWDRGEV